MSNERLLLVDDDPHVAWTLGRYLLRQGYAVTTCNDGAEAVPLLEAHDFDALITDVQMPRLNGLALIEWCRENRPGLRVIVMTAYGSQAVRDVAHRRGALLYLEKPLDPQLLVDVLKAPAEEEGIVGSVAEIELFDYIQLLLIGRKRAHIEVTAVAGAPTRIYLDGGDVIHACDGLRSGEEAFYACLLEDRGHFVNLPWQEPERTISRRGDYLLMEAARRRDESGQHLAVELEAEPPESSWDEIFEAEAELLGPPGGELIQEKEAV